MRDNEIPYVSHKHKIIFVHIPKNAGTTVAKSLGITDNGIGKLTTQRGVTASCGKDVLGSHILPTFYEQFKELDTYVRVYVERDPYERFLSSYRYAVDTNNYYAQRGIVHPDVGIVRKFSLLEFCLLFDRLYQALFHPGWHPQALWVYAIGPQYPSVGLMCDELATGYNKLTGEVLCQSVNDSHNTVDFGSVDVLQVAAAVKDVVDKYYAQDLTGSPYGKKSVMHIADLLKRWDV